MKRSLSTGLLLCAMTVAGPGVAGAQPKTARKPAGTTAVSSLVVALSRGDAAFLARDFEGARGAYRDGIKAAPQSAQGHLRMAQLHLHLGELDLADEVLGLALRFVSTDLRQKAQAATLLAMLRERQLRYDDALLAWTSYEQLAASAAPAQAGQQIFVGSAQARRRAIEAQQKAAAEAVGVKERMQKRLDEATLSTPLAH